MVKSNEFYGATLSEAVGKATAAYRVKRTAREPIDQRRCNDLVLEMSHLSREAGRYADEADRLADKAEDLRREAIAAGLIAFASLLGGLAVGLLKGKRVARALSRMRKGDLSRQTILEFLEVFGPIAAAAGALRTVQKFREAEELSRKAQDLSARAERTGRTYLQAFDEYDRHGCGRTPGFTGT